MCMHMTSTFPGSPQQQLQQGYAGRDDTESLGSCMRAVRCQPYQPQKPCSTATCCPCRAGSNRLCVHARPCKLQMEGQQVGGQWDLAIQFDAMTVFTAVCQSATLLSTTPRSAAKPPCTHIGLCNITAACHGRLQIQPEWSRDFRNTSNTLNRFASGPPPSGRDI